MLFKYFLGIALVSLLVFGGAVVLADNQPRPSIPGKMVPRSGAGHTAATGQRVMQMFDFEERDIHYLPQPMYWKKVSARTLGEMGYQKGFPHYATGNLDTANHRSGKYSFKLITDGGSIGFEYEKRRIRAKPGSDFQITGYVRLEDADNCRAQISCGLTDRLGKLIPGSIHTSELARQSDQARDGWKRLEVYIPGNFPAARYITIGLWVLQQQQWSRQERSEFQIFRKNVEAVAWFDDITVHQLPRVILRTDQLGNIFGGDTDPRLQVEVEGVGALDYHVRLTVHGAEGEFVRDESWVLTGVEGETKLRSIKLGDLPAGLYHAKLEIFSADTLVTTRSLTFANLAELSAERTGSGQGFGVILMDGNRNDWQSEINLTRMLNTKLLKLPVWPDQSVQNASSFMEDNFDRRLIDLQQQKIQVVATFCDVPDELAMKMDTGQRSLLDVLSKDVRFWRRQVAFALAQYARQVPYWQIGGDFSPDKSWDPRIRNVIGTLRKEFDKLVKDTVLAAPLNCMFDVNLEKVGTTSVAMEVPSAILAEHIPAYLDDCRARGLDNIWATIEPLDGKIYAREHVLIDFAKRIAYAKKGYAKAVYINHPWRRTQHNARTVIEPTELYLVFRTMADQLGSTRYVGEFEIRPGIPALIFDRDGQGCIFTWNADYDPQSGREPSEAQLYLGESPIMIDLFGNCTSLPVENGVTKLRMGRWPVLLGNIDSRIAVLRSSLELSPDTIEASISRQKMRLRFVNPFSSTISGQLRFLIDHRHQRNWMVEPISLNFILQPQQWFEQEITMKFPGNELGGKKKLNILFRIDADRNYNIRNSIPFEIRLFGVDMNIFTRRINGSDLLIQQMVTNDSDQEITLNSFVDLPDQDRLERAIARLQPGATITKSYLIRDADKWLGQNLRIGLYDPKGTKRINYHIEIN